MPDIKKTYTKLNSIAWDKWVSDGIEWGIPISHEEYIAAQNDEWGVYLTPCKYVPKAWFADIKGKKILGLASGGGQQMPIFAALGAKCTVFDFSDKQLASEKAVAERENYSIEIIKGDMTKMLPFSNESFDIIFHPVSNCYAEDIYHIWNECARILKPNGILLAGFDNGISFMFENDEEPLLVKQRLPFNPIKNPEQMELLNKQGSGVQFSHSLEEQLGGQLKAGFTLVDLYEDCDREGTGVLHQYTPQYMATKAIKRI